MKWGEIMSKVEGQEDLRLLAGLERIARILTIVPEELLAAWLYYDIGLSKTQCKNVIQSVKRLLEILSEGEK